MGVLLESCATNYVVSATPSTTTNIAAIPKTNSNYGKINRESLHKAKSSLYADLDISKPMPENTFVLEKSYETNTAIAEAIKYEKTVDDILKEAKTYIGTPYRFGGMSRRGIDCSAFVLSVFNEAIGIDLPRVASEQSREGERIDSMGDLRKGDLVFFSTRGGNRISHVGIVENVEPNGDVKFIHASSSNGVTISTLNSGYWSLKYRFGKRIIQ